MSKYRSYNEFLVDSLQNPNEAAEYLNAALLDGDIDGFLLALQNVVQSQGGMTKLSEKANKSRSSLYKSMSENGNPYLRNTNEILNALGMHLAIIPNKKEDLNEKRV